jgi:hypothetical protein
MSGPQYFDAETISVMKSAFDETCAAVPEPKACACRSLNAFSNWLEPESVIVCACGTAP